MKIAEAVAIVNARKEALDAAVFTGGYLDLEELATNIRTVVADAFVAGAILGRELDR